MSLASYRPLGRGQNRVNTLNAKNSPLSGIAQVFGRAENLGPSAPDFSQLPDRLAAQIYVFDTDSLRYTYLNQSALEKLGWEGQDYTQFTPADDDEFFDEVQFRELTRPLLEGKVNEVCFSRSIHGIPQTDIRIRLTPDQSGKDAFLAVVRPPMKAAEHWNLISSVTELSPVATAVIQGDSGEILYANQNFRHKFGLPYDELSGQNIAEIFDALGADELQKIVAKVVEGDRGNLSIELKIPEVGHFELAFSRVEFDKNRTDLALIVRDITDRIEREVQRHEFLATISHELKTPLASIIGTLSTVLYGGITDPELVTKLARLAKTNANRLEAMVEQILAKETAEMNVHRPSKTDWFKFIDDSVRLNKHYANSAGVELTFRSRGKGGEVMLDHGNFGRVLDNLISNAVRHGGAPGQILVEASVKGDRAYLSVKDKGQGIPPHQMTEIFDWHFVGDASDSRRVGGTGLGLGICRRIMQTHGGDIQARNRREGGASFEVTLPLADHIVTGLTPNSLD